ncbi:DUF2000 family protein [Robbsia sp. KACC 23696]|uniref:DUF2000 family protein n=1 Tax=Robbsia sp. KACC 23696 TaxID=3149231 RepID=UPI00325B8CA0
MGFDSKVVIAVRDDLADWQKLNVAAFLAGGIAAAAPEAMGQPYIDAAGRRYAPLLGQPMAILTGDAAALQRAVSQAHQRELTVTAFVAGMFTTGNDADNRTVFQQQTAEDGFLVGVALRGEGKQVDKATKGLSRHG